MKYFKRTLTGKKAVSKVSVLASEEKNMTFVYKLSKANFPFPSTLGEWNTYGFPQHN